MGCSKPTLRQEFQMAEMSPLRRRMIEDMTIRNLSPATQQSYLYAVSKFGVIQRIIVQALSSGKGHVHERLVRLDGERVVMGEDLGRLDDLIGAAPLDLAGHFQVQLGAP